MSFNKFLSETILPGAVIYEEIAKKKAVTLVQTDDVMTYGWNLTHVSEPAKRLIRMFKDNPANMLELILTGKILLEGPKVFEVGQLDMEMLIHTDLNVLATDYRQPFSTIIIQLPEAFCKNRVVHAETLGPAEPDFCVLHHDVGLNTYVFAMYYDNDVSIKSGFTPVAGADLESMFVDSRRMWENSLEMNDQEWRLFEDLFRASLNYCLLLDQLGMKKLGPANSKHHARLTEQVAKNNEHSSTNRRLLKQMPIRYELDQQVKLKPTTQVIDSPGSTNGTKVCPHHRRGHHRQQKHGVGLSQTKRIWIPPIFVNAELFLGKMSDTKVVYSS